MRDPLRGGLLIAGATSDAGKSWLTAALCRVLARRGVSVAPFKAQNMALNAAVTAGGAEIGHAQWVQALAAGVPAEAAMNPVLLKPTSERTSQVIVSGRPWATLGAAQYHRRVQELVPVVHEALADLRSRFDVVLCEGAGGAAEINLLDRDLANLPLAVAAGLPAIVVGDIERGGVFAALHGTVDLLPPELRAPIRGFVINRFRGDPALLGDGTAVLQARSGLPTFGVIPRLEGAEIDAEDSLALDRWRTGPAAVTPGRALDVAVIRLPRIANFGDLDPLRIEPEVSVRAVAAPAELGRPHLVVIPGSKNTRSDLAWLRETGLAQALAGLEHDRSSIVAICAGLQICGRSISDPDGIEGDPGSVEGLGLLAVDTIFEADKVLDRPHATVVAGPGARCPADGYRIHHGRVVGGPDARPWLVGADDAVLGWHADGVIGTSVHGLFENDELRAALVGWAANRAGIGPINGGRVRFGAARDGRLDAAADAVETHLDIDRLLAVITEGAPIAAGSRS